jgi:hypothetical protein
VLLGPTIHLPLTHKDGRTLRSSEQKSLSGFLLLYAQRPNTGNYCTVHLTKKIYYSFEQNRFSCNLLCASFARRITHMQKGAFQNIQEPFQKSNSNFTSLRGALERLRSIAVACPPRQSGTTGLLLRPSSRACFHAAPGHLRRLHGDPPETQALNADAARVTNSGECKIEFSNILADAIKASGIRKNEGVHLWGCRFFGGVERG